MGKLLYLLLLLLILLMLGVSIGLGIVFFKSLPTFPGDEPAPPEGTGQVEKPGIGPAVSTLTPPPTPGLSGGIRKYSPATPSAPPSGPTGSMDISRLYRRDDEEALTAQKQTSMQFLLDCTGAGMPFDFMAPGASFDIFLAPSEIVFCMRRANIPPSEQTRYKSEEEKKSHLVDCGKIDREVCLTMRLLGASPRLPSAGAGTGVGMNNFLRGTDPRQWITDLPAYTRIQYNDAYPGIALSCYADQNRFEYVFVIKPGGNPSDIDLTFRGADAVSLTEGGGMLLDFEGGRLVQGAPAVYEVVDGVPYPLEADLSLDKGRVSVSVKKQDEKAEVRPDSVTFLGGGGRDIAYCVAVDSMGYAYVAGETTSKEFGSSARAAGGGADVFVTKYRIADSHHVYTTFLGGSADDRAFGIVADQFGNAYICGETLSPDFPAADRTAAAGQVQSWDAFITKLDPSGGNVEFTYRLPGSGDDRAYGLALDSAGLIYVAGETTSRDFPFTRLFRANDQYGAWDAFVACLDPSGAFLHYASCLGGTGKDTAYGIAVDPRGFAVIGGGTSSRDFPLRNPAQDDYGGGESDAFVARLSPLGELIYSSFLGGANDDRAQGIGSDVAGNAYLIGETASRDFPHTNAVQRLHGGGDWDAFLAKFLTDGSVLFSTYFGGSGDDRGFAISPDSSGNASFGGATSSTNLPVFNADQSSHGGGRWDAFLGRLGTGGPLAFSTYIGGSGEDSLYGVAVDARRSAHIAGSTSSTNLPVVNPLQGAYHGGGDDAFAAQIPPPFRPQPELCFVGGGEQPGGPEYDFYFGKYEITNEEFVRFLNDAQANTNNARGSNMFFDDAGGVWFNPAMQRDKHEVFNITASRVVYFPSYPLGARYHVSPALPAHGGSYSNHPAAGMSWFAAVKYSNWLTVDSGRGAEERCYREGTNALAWAPVTSRPADWARGYMSNDQREQWLKYGGFRLPMDNCHGNLSYANPYNEFLKASAWNGSTNMPYSFGRTSVEPGDANFLDHGAAVQHDSTPVGFFDGTDHGGKFATKPNRNRYGIHDLSGGVTEWLTDPGTTNRTMDRACYGGSWMFSLPKNTDRFYVSPSFTDRFRGFRLVTTQAPEMIRIVRVPYGLCLKGCIGDKEVDAEVEEEEEPPAEPTEEEEGEKETLAVDRGTERPPGVVYESRPIAPFVPEPGPPSPECPSSD